MQIPLPQIDLPANWPELLGRLALLAAGAWLLNALASRYLRRVLASVSVRTAVRWDDRLAESLVIRRVPRIVFPLVLFAGIGPALGVTPAAVVADPGALTAAAYTVVRRLTAAWIALAVARAFTAFLDLVNDIYKESYAEARSRPIKGYLQVASILVWLAAIVTCVAVLAGRSPVFFLSGIGAIAAVLLLIFRDTILSLVASVQIAFNDMIRIGDWVSLPQANCDGEVIDVALHTVKVQNWDKSISTIPMSRFISDSFRNWRGMSESGGRRIKRALRLDMNSVRFLTDEEIDALGRRELLQEYMQRAVEQLAAYNRTKAEGNPGVIPEIRRLTNLGTFRVYVQKYLEAHPMTHKEMTLLVRQLEPGPQGVPIEIYCFSSDTAWARYEGFQADVFDHLIAILPDFGLRTFQSPAGSDFKRALGGGADRLDAAGSGAGGPAAALRIDPLEGRRHRVDEA